MLPRSFRSLSRTFFSYNRRMALLCMTLVPFFLDISVVVVQCLVYVDTSIPPSQCGMFYSRGNEWAFFLHRHVNDIPLWIIDEMECIADSAEGDRGGAERGGRRERKRKKEYALNGYPPPQHRSIHSIIIGQQARAFLNSPASEAMDIWGT